MTTWPQMSNWKLALSECFFNDNYYVLEKILRYRFSDRTRERCVYQIIEIYFWKK